MKRLSEILQAIVGRLGHDSPHRWFRVSFDQQHVTLAMLSEQRQVLQEQCFAWSAITRICFKDNGPLESDVLYVFVAGRDDSYAIPLESNGGVDFWIELRRRDLFPSSLHEQASASMGGQFYCWPPLPPAPPRQR